jgi:hypothetical protein
MKPGTSITLNGNNQYEVVNVSSQPALFVRAAPPQTQETSTDVGLILFKSSDCATATLGRVQPIALGNQNNKNELSNRVLIAGYGITSPGADDSGVLHAGYNEWAVSDYSKTDPALAGAVQSLAKNIVKIPDDQLIMMGDRTAVYTFMNQKGQKIADRAVDMSGMKKIEASLPLPGDSGGAAIAFDSHNKPYIVGVTSMAAPQAMPLGSRLLVLDPSAPQAEPIFMADLTPMTPFDDPATMMAKATDEMMKKLVELKYIDASNTVLKNFGVMQTSGRMAMGTYASVTNSLNYPYITATLAAFEKARDAANYCQ